ncbi:MAG: type II toxin-antitoxin system VapC family toxin [Thermodesulfovibrionales bacterium]
MKDKVLIDTSVWIDYFKGNNVRLHEKTDEVLTYSDVYVPKVVIAELLQGARSEKEISVIESFVEAFTIIDQAEDTWVKAGKLSFSMKRKGVSINLVDCYIAVLTAEHNCAIFTLDEHFRSIKKFIKIELYS